MVYSVVGCGFYAEVYSLVVVPVFVFVEVVV